MIIDYILGCELPMTQFDDDINLKVDEFDLEDLIILGDDKKIPIHITFPRTDGTKVKAKALIKQLTLKELDNLRITGTDVWETNIIILQRALFKTNGENFNEEEISVLPVGVVNAISNKILELSGVEFTNQQLRDF